MSDLPWAYGDSQSYGAIFLGFFVEFSKVLGGGYNLFPGRLIKIPYSELFSPVFAVGGGGTGSVLFPGEVNNPIQERR